MKLELGKFEIKDPVCRQIICGKSRIVCKQRRGGSTCIGGRQADRMPFGNCKTW